jgi:ankyrin repeat protein
MICRGADINAVNRNGYTPLMKAATTVHIDCTDCVITLLKHKADVFKKDRKGKTALEWARLTNNAHVSRALEIYIQRHIYACQIAHANQEAEEKTRDLILRHDTLVQAIAEAITSYDGHKVTSTLS